MIGENESTMPQRPVVANGMAIADGACHGRDGWRRSRCRHSGRARRSV